MRVKLTRYNGVLKVDIGGTLYDPLSFKSFRANPKNVSEFYNAGVRLFSVLSSGIICALGVPYSLYGESWVGENEYDFSAIDRQMDMFIENAPEGYFALMLQIDTRDWYLKLHPEVPNSFTHLSQIACDETWKKQAADYLKAAITHCEEKYGDRIYGYFILGGMTTEWFSGSDYEAPHPIKEKAYQRWTGDEHAKLPDKTRLDSTGDAFLSADEDDIRVFRKFHSGIVADLILYFAEQAQSIVKHNKLIGVYYGYLFECAGWPLYNHAILEYEKVYSSPDIDMISSPSAYAYRKIQDPSAFMTTQKTLDAHNKLYFLEFDHRTHVAPGVVNEPPVGGGNQKLTVIPGGKNAYQNETETLNVMYRDFLLCNANKMALWWFDMFDGWFRGDSMMNAVAHMLQIQNKLSKLPTQSVGDLAVFAEGNSLYRVRKTSRVGLHALDHILRVLAECGVGYHVYSMMDMRLAETDNYKAYLFVNQYDIPSEAKTLITARLQKRGKTAIWLYAPNYATDGKNNVDNISAWTGIKTVESNLSHGGIVFNGNTTVYNVEGPYFSIADEHATPLAYYQDGTVAAAYKRIDGCISVYVSTCNLPSDLLREIVRLAGCFIYSESPRVYVYPNSASIGVYNASETEATISVQQDGTYEDLIENVRYTSKDGKLTLPKKEMNAFLLIKE
ncbi:MAG: hypothetical protein E7357_02820 [Clostridiales bacterium]|nr:hypothetical protein [Clostridiales bacterium]